jgi:hypothetical protein
MKRRIVSIIAVVALALAEVGLVAGPAGAAKPTITAGPGSSVHCAITAKVKLYTKLKNEWVQADHQSDPSAAVRAIPDTRFSENGPVATRVKGKGTCSGSITDGVSTASVFKVKFELTSDPLHPGSSDPATCASLLAGGESTARYNSVIQWKSKEAKVTNTAVHDAAITPAGLGFETSGGTVSGSFAGGSSVSQGNVDGDTILAFTQAPPTSTNPVPTYRQCQPSIKLKTKKGVQSAKLKKPKGFKKITIVPGSTLDISR